MNGYDLIGDVHGQADKLEHLLSLLGYQPRGKSYRPPFGRKAVFLGDLIDTGPAQLRVLEIVRAMIDAGDALCIMGNHEFNAIGYATEDPFNPGETLRPHRSESDKCKKNRDQHEHFLAQVGGEGSRPHKDWVEWFKQLPPCIDLDGLRVVHGCWDDDAVAALASAGWHAGKPLSDELLVEVSRKDENGGLTPVGDARQLLTCGMELPLPEGRFIVGRNDKHKHYEVRIANWRHWADEFHQVALVPANQRDVVADLDWPSELELTEITGTPVFVGHHWFTGQPVIESPKFACLDWSAANTGPLVAYRWDGEDELGNDKLVWAGGTSVPA